LESLKFDTTSNSLLGSTGARVHIIYILTTRYTGLSLRKCE
jgi:hypothetical protein